MKEVVMANKNSSRINKRMILVWGVPAAILLSTAFLNLRPLFQQMLVGLILIWFYAALLFVGS
jgi:hypothetical protein